MQVHKIEIEPLAALLAKRWRKRPDRRAESLPELQEMAMYKYALPPGHRTEVCWAIEDRAKEIENACRLGLEKGDHSVQI